jgi:hypothetical protein
MPSHVGGAALLSGLMLASFAAAMAQAKLRGIDVECGCFGGASRVSWWKVGLNLALALSAFAVAAGYASRRPIRPGMVESSS